MALHFSKRIEITQEQEGGWMPEDTEEVTIARPWAAIKTLDGKEIQLSNVTANIFSSRFIIRYREGITPDMKVKYKGKTYDILSITNDDEQNRTLTLICEASK